MTDETFEDRLREIAQHRGLKLVKSRRRKAGVGDYGKFGLTDAHGRPLLGISEHGLTATPEEIHAFFRTDTLGSWEQSAETTPDRPAPKAVADTTAASEAAEPAVRRKREVAAKPAGRRPRGQGEAADRAASSRKRSTHKAPAPPTKPRSRPETKAAAEDVPGPELVLRHAKASDAPAIATLLRGLDKVEVDKQAVAANLVAIRSSRRAGLVVAELGALIGCCGWAVIPTVHRGPLGRLTVIIVDRDHRRQGVATALVAFAEKELARMGCKRLEAMSDIAISNAHNFFRALKFEQASYRFARPIGERPGPPAVAG